MSSAANTPPTLIKRSVKEEILKPRYREAFGPVIDSVLLEQGLAAQLCNALHDAEKQKMQQRAEQARHQDRPSTARPANSPLPPPEIKELDVIEMMLDTWSAKLIATLQAHCDETGLPLMRVGDGGRGGGGARAARGSKFLYTIDDVASLLENAEHPNRVDGRKGGRSWCLSPLELWTPRLPQLRQLFAELAPAERQSGLDDEMRAWYADERYAIGSRLLATSYAPMLMQYARNGVPAGLRGRVWLGALRLGAVSERDYNYFAALQREISRVFLCTDGMVKADAAAPAREEDYFVFGELVEEIVLAFCRDPTVSQGNAGPKPRPVIGKTRSGENMVFPPSGVPPFKGLADFVCPLCFVYNQPPELYYVFREMWTRYWSKLHTFSTAPGTLLPLVRLFEDLLQETAPAVCFHLLRIELYPGRVALGWIASGFASFLPADQTLVLWDRIVGFGSLELLPILAAAIFVYRARWLLQASEATHVQRLLLDATGLKVVPLLQLFLADHNQLVSLQGE